MKVYVDRVLSVRPEMNPDLGLPERLETRPGISDRTQPIKVDEYDWTTKGGLRAIEDLLKSQGFMPKDEDVEFVFTA